MNPVAVGLLILALVLITAGFANKQGNLIAMVTGKGEVKA